MGGIIAGVRSTAISIVNARLGTDEEPLQYVLSPFSDPYTGPLTATNDANVYKGAISRLFASGGGDCPELSMTGVYDGLAASDEGGNLFLFTDASSKDASLAGAVAGLAKKKDIQIYPMLFGSCSPIDPAYLGIANQTGGQVFFLNSYEAANVTQLANLTVRNNAVQILSVLDQYPSPKTYPIPVDLSLKQLTVSVSSSDQATLPKVTLTRPDGTQVLASDPVTYLTLSRALIISVPTPGVGLWSLQIENSSGATFVNASGVSDLKFSSFNFADVGGQPPHEGLFNIQGSPVAGQSLYAMASLTQGFASTAFQLRRKNFDALQSLPLEADQTDTTKFFGKVTVPTEQFLAYVNGTDTSGNAFQRVVPVSVTPQTVTITAPAPQDLRPGKTTSLMFQATNFGAAGSFNFSVTDDKGFVTAVTPGTFALGTGESVNVTIQVTPPLGTLIGSSDTLSATVQSTATPSLRNNADLTLFVTGATQTSGKPNFLAGIVGQTQVSPGIYDIDVRFTNRGPGTAKSFSISKLIFRTLTGSGAVTYKPLVLVSQVKG